MESGKTYQSIIQISENIEIKIGVAFVSYQNSSSEYASETDLNKKKK